MIENNTIKFGYGTILIGSNQLTRTVLLQHIAPPKEIGKDLTKEDIADIVVINEIEFKYERDMNEFYNELIKINENNTQLEFRGYKLDFSKYNEGSVKTLKQAVKRTISGCTIALAC